MSSDEIISTPPPVPAAQFDARSRPTSGRSDAADEADRGGLVVHVVRADDPAGDQPPHATTSVRRKLAAAARTVWALVGRAGHGLIDAWRRSVQFRVGVTTVVVTGAVVVAIGIFLVDKVAGGVLQSKRTAAISQAKLGLGSARSALQDVDAGLYAEVTEAQRQLYSVLAAGTVGAGTFSIVLTTNSIAGNDSIPADLRNAVRRGNVATAYAPVPRAGAKGLVKGLIVGEPIASRTGLFELYYRFPLTAEEETIALIQRTVALAGLALIILVFGIAQLVTRQVVKPVRVAARTAESLAAGDLSQRITVRGRDDLALLGQSFNDMADSLQRQIRRLEDLSRLQQRFTSDVSHELRTPLTTIRMAAELLHSGREEFPPELARSAELLDTELDRFETLLGDLLEISRYDAGVAHLESAVLDVRDVVDSAVDATRLLAVTQGSEVVIRVPDEPVTADIDVRRVERILRNLLGNALDHGEGAPVEITVGMDDDAVAIAVRDHGIGLKPGQAAMVFNRFWRGDASRSRLTGGTGLGLAIALEDARLHDGWLQAWGEPGEGAQFRLTLPRRAGHTLMHSPLPLDPNEPEEEDG